jgi:23S rRNA pseudouridine1911/1915/1917 synthase
MGFDLMVTVMPNLGSSEEFADNLLDDDVEDVVDANLEREPIVLKLSDEDCGQRVDKVLARLMPQFSRNRIQSWLEDGLILIDGKVARTKATVYGDEVVNVSPQPQPEETAFTPEAMDLQIVYEDEAIIVLNKPAGLVVHPAPGNWSGTLLNGLLHHHPALANVPRAGIVHRLDKETSGLMVIAKTLEAHADLVRQLQARTVKREYLALVWGRPVISGTVDKPMARHPRERVKMAVSNQDNAKPAITHFQRLATGVLESRPVSLVLCQLETGRTHQIRVHMQALGFPLVGDGLYGKSHLASVFHRQALQARRLGLLHPNTGDLNLWKIDLADDFSALLVRAGIDAQAVIPE